TLASIFERENLDHVDFVKIDIEGAEPLLLDDLVRLSDRITAILIEFGPYQPAEAYLPFFDALHQKGFVIHSRSEERRFDSPKSARAYYLDKRASGAADDFWFVKQTSA